MRARLARVQTRSRMEAGMPGTIDRTARMPCPAVAPNEECAMKWETPQAVDNRFGFEITMYISTR